MIPVVAAEVIEAVERPPTETLLAFSRVMRGKLAGNIESIETITQKMTKLDLSKRDDAATFVMMGYTRMYARLFGLESADTVLNVEEFIEIAAKVVKAEYDNLVAQQNVTGPDQKSPMPAISSFIVYTAGYRFLERHIKEHAQQVLPNAERAKEQAANKLVRHEEALQRQASKKKGKRARTDSLQGTIVCTSVQLQARSREDVSNIEGRDNNKRARTTRLGQTKNIQRKQKKQWIEKR